jgi:hypothetical protein
MSRSHAGAAQEAEAGAVRRRHAILAIVEGRERRKLAAAKAGR